MTPEARDALSPDQLLDAVRAVVFHPPQGANDAERVAALRFLLRRRHKFVHEEGAPNG